MNEHELDELLNLDDMKEMKSVNKRLKKKMWKKIIFSVVIVIVCLSIVTVAGFHGTSQVVKQMYYNPISEEDIIDREKFPVDGNNFTFQILMATFISMEFPGYIYTQYETDNESIDEGYSQYTMNGKVHNTFDPLKVDGISNAVFTIQKSKMTMTGDFRASRIAQEFKGVKTPSQFIAPDPLIDKKTIQNIKDLPKSAVLDVSLSFDDVYSPKEFLELKKRYQDVDFRWLALETGNEYGCADGINISNRVMFDLKEEFLKKYPTFYLPSQFNEEELLQNYLSHLQFLMDHEEFMNVVSSWYPNTTIDTLKTRYDYVKKNGINAIGVKCSVSRDDLLNMIEKDGYKYMVINDAKFSVFED